MILKEQTPPIIIQQLRTLLRRLPFDHPKRELIQDDLKKFEAGFRGEQNVHYFLRFLPENPYHIFYDLKLAANNLSFQIDILLLTPYLIIILEVKNIYGILFFEKQFHQLIRTANNKEEGFANPIYQAQRHQSLLKQWLKENRFSKDIPVEYLVIISNPASILRTSETAGAILDKVIHAEKSSLKIETLLKKYQCSHLDSRQIKKLSKALIKADSNVPQSVLQKYGLSSDEIQKGVQCPNCSAIPLFREHGYWLCDNCNTSSRSCHKEALIDYLLLIQPTISNEQCRDFLRISSRYTALSLLKSYGLAVIQNGRGSYYSLPADFFPN